MHAHELHDGENPEPTSIGSLCPMACMVRGELSLHQQKVELPVSRKGKTGGVRTLTVSQTFPIRARGPPSLCSPFESGIMLGRVEDRAEEHLTNVNSEVQVGSFAPCVGHHRGPFLETPSLLLRFEYHLPPPFTRSPCHWSGESGARCSSCWGCSVSAGTWARRQGQSYSSATERIAWGSGRFA